MCTASLPFALLDRGLDEIHRGRADEAADEEVHRPLVELLRGRDLLELALAHHGDPMSHRHRLDLVVGDVDRRHSELVLEARDLRSHVDAELRVEVRERLVHEVRLRLPDDRPPHCHPLPLAARERAWLAIEEGLEPEDVSGLPHALVDLVLRRLSQAQPEGDVVVDREMRIERVALEDHRDVPISRRHAVHDAVADPERAFRDVLEPRDHAERRRLPTPGRADENHELAVGDREIHAGDGPGSVGIDLAHTLEGHSSHGDSGSTLVETSSIVTSTGG